MQTQNVITLLDPSLEVVLNEDAFQKQRQDVVEKAFNTLFAREEAGKLNWRRCGTQLTEITTNVNFYAEFGEAVSIPATIFSVVSDFGYRTYYLRIGEGDGSISKNDADKRVKNLHLKLTGRQD